ncbi:hypothetical protein EON80_09590 [bacterium]|nr:MAG: hypothetical protein EON80_09590 [bacterium]
MLQARCPRPQETKPRDIHYGRPIFTLIAINLSKIQPQKASKNSRLFSTREGTLGLFISVSKGDGGHRKQCPYNFRSSQASSKPSFTLEWLKLMHIGRPFSAFNFVRLSLTGHIQLEVGSKVGMSQFDLLRIAGFDLRTANTITQ